MAQEQQAGSSGPSQDAIASLITQVSPTGQPARAPARPARPRQGTGNKKPSTVGKPTATSKTTATSPASAAATTAPTLSSQAGDAAAQSDVTPVLLPPATTAPPTTTTGHDTPTTEEATNKSYASTSAGESSKVPVAIATSEGNNVQTDASQHTSASPAGGSTARSGPQQQQQAKKKKKGFFASLFGSCMSSSSHDDDEKQQSTSSMTERKAGQANATRPGGSAAAGAANKLHKTNSAGAGGVAMMPAGSASNSRAGGQTGPDSLNPSGSAGSAALAAGAGGLAAGAAVGAASFAVRTPGGSSTPIPGTPVVPPSPTISQTGSGQHPPADIAPEVLAANQRGGTHLPRDETADVLSGAVQAPGSEGLTPKKDKRRKSSGEASSMAMSGDGLAADESHVSSASSTGDEALEDSEDEYLDEDERIIAAGGMGIPVDENGLPRPLLAELTPSDNGRKCLVLDLDETLLHSSFKQVHAPDFIVPVEIENQVHNVYVLKRPGVDAFMKRVGELYEIVVFTASLSKYADPVLDKLDIHRVVKHRLFRESCYNHKGNYVKDLSQLGRPIGDTIIIDNSPASYIFHPNNAVPVSSWFNDPHDTELTDLQHFLTDLAEVPDVRGVLDGGLYPVNEL